MTIYDDLDYLHTLDVEDTLSKEIIRIADLKAQIDVLEAERKMLSEHVIKQLTADGHRTVGVSTPQGERMRVTINRSSTKDVNLVQLRALNWELYEAITKRVVDATQLDRAINTHKFDEATMHTIRIVEKAPYLRFTPIIDRAGADE